MLKEYKLKTKAARIDKVVFPILMKQLWDQVKPEHVVAGFRETGIHPLNSKVIPEEKLQPSVVFNARSDPIAHSQEQEAARRQIRPG